MTTRTLRRPGRAIVVLVGAALALLLGAGTASAQLFGDCKEPPTPQWPGDGFVGDIDHPELGRGQTGTTYDDYSFAGQTWEIWDTCSSSAQVDAWFGNMAFNVGKLFVGLTNSVHWMQRESGMLQPVDEIVATTTADLWDNAFGPWIGVALAIAAVSTLWWSLRGNLAQVGKKTLWTLAGLTFAASTYLTPMAYTTLFDEVLGRSMDEIQSALLTGNEMTGPTALPSTLHEQAVYRNWLAGEFGGADTPEAQRVGRDLLDAKACSKWERAAADEGQPCPVEAKQTKFENIANQLEQTPAYSTFTGQSNARTGYGVKAAIDGIVLSSFQLICLAAVFVAMLILRVAVLCGPILGALAVIKGDILVSVFKAIATALLSGITLAVVSVVHFRVITGVLNTVAYPANMILIVIITALLWLAIKPHRKLRSMFEASLKPFGVETMPWEQLKQYRMMRRLTRGQNRQTRVAEAGQQQIYNVLVHGGGGRPEVNDQPLHAPSQRLYDPPAPPRRDALHATSVRPDDDGGAPPHGGSGPSAEPSAPPVSGSGGTVGEQTDQRVGRHVAIEGGDSSLPSEVELDQHTGGQDSPHESTSQPQGTASTSADPEIILPSHYRAEGDDAGSDPWTSPDRDTAEPSGPSEPSPSRREGDTTVWRVYRPSSGQVEDDNDPAGRASAHSDRPRPEGE